jgi:hypothetical protein
MTKARTLADNFAADINGITAGTGISGGGTSGTVTVTNDMATAIDAKGDLVGGTGADAFARLAVGANGTVLTADSVETTGLKWATPSQSPFTGCLMKQSQSIPNSTYTAMTFTSEIVDTDGFHDNSSNTSRITIPVGFAGKYLFNSSWVWQSGANQIKVIQYKLNGTVDVQTVSNVSNQQWTPWFPYIVNLAEGDYVEAFIYHEIGSTQNQNGWFQAVYLGA